MQQPVSQSIKNTLEAIFSHYGIPETLRIDNGPYFCSQLFAKFANNMILLIPIVALTSLLVMEKQKRQCRQLNICLRLQTIPPLAFLSYKATPFSWYRRLLAELLMEKHLHIAFKNY